MTTKQDPVKAAKGLQTIQEAGDRLASHAVQSAAITGAGGWALHAGYGVSVPFLATWVGLFAAFMLTGYVVRLSAKVYHATRREATPASIVYNMDGGALMSAVVGGRRTPGGAKGSEARESEAFAEFMKLAFGSDATSGGKDAPAAESAGPYL